MADLIDRQAAMDALARIFDQCEEIEAHLPKGDPDITGYKMFPDYMIVWEYLHQLPSAETELDEWCTDCKEYDHERHCCPRWNRVIRETLKDVEDNIVRCKDCKYYNPIGVCIEMSSAVCEDSFCCWAERKENG